LENFNAGTSKIIARLSTNIKTQSIDIAEKTTSQTLDTAMLKQAWADAKSTLIEVQKIYKDALPKVEAQVKLLENINTEADEFIKKMESKEGTAATSLQIIEDLGK
jgi:uncharacterized protein YaaN involved in tellurite resistance